MGARSVVRRLLISAGPAAAVLVLLAIQVSAYAIYKVSAARR
jgi:hypothetical protein